MPQFLFILLGLFFAVVLDLLLGDPPTAVHPVGWQGRYISWLWNRRSGTGKKAVLFAQGLFIVASGFILTGAAAWALQRMFGIMAGWGGKGSGWIGFFPASLLTGVVLKGALSFKGLLAAGSAVGDSLAVGDVEAARKLTAFHMVSRSTENMSESEICSAALESLSENFTDSVAAPFLWYGLGGITAAWCYRFANTADAMLGYREGDKEWGGKAAARLDDVLSWLPSRIAGYVMVLAAVPAGADFRGALRVLRNDRKRVPSPNSGWTMAAAAGAMGVRLEKAGIYVLNPVGRSPDPGDIRNLAKLLYWSLAILGLAMTPVIAATAVLTGLFQSSKGVN